MAGFNEVYGYKQITATTQIEPGVKTMGGIFVSSASATPTITVYDSSVGATTNKIVDTFTPVAGSNYPFPANLYDGLYIVISGTVSCTVFYA